MKLILAARWFCESQELHLLSFHLPAFLLPISFATEELSSGTTATTSVISEVLQFATWN